MDIGQFFTTNIGIKTRLSLLTKKYVRKDKKKITILEPSFGQGHLVDNLTRHLTSMALKIDGCEIDDKIPYLFDTTKIKREYCDFLEKNFGKKKYDLIIGNPPYIKKEKQNLYIKFMEKCLLLLRKKGILVFVIPSTFLQLTKSNEKIIDLIRNNFKIKYIHAFHDEKMFENATIDVIIIVIKKIKNKKPKEIKKKYTMIFNGKKNKN